MLAGLTADVAASFKEALATIRKDGDELAGAMVDLGLPDRPGDELVDEIRALYPNMPIIQRRVMRTKASETASQM